MTHLQPVERKKAAMPVTVSRILVVAAVVVFILAALGVTVLGLAPVELVAAGLALLGASFIA